MLQLISSTLSDVKEANESSVKLQKYQQWRRKDPRAVIKCTKNSELLQAENLKAEQSYVFFNV